MLDGWDRVRYLIGGLNNQMPKTRNWSLARLGFHCRCNKCLAECGVISKRVGKFWQARYGESAIAFKARYKRWHKDFGG